MATERKTLADALVLKSIMSIIAVCEGKEHPPIVCEIHSDRDRDLAQNISNGKLKALNEVSVLSRMITNWPLAGMAYLWFMVIWLVSMEMSSTSINQKGLV